MTSVTPGPPGQPGVPASPAEVADLVGAVARRIRRASSHDLGPLGVTWAQVRALRTLDACGRPVRMSELADRLHIARRSATSVVDELVERDLVERAADPSDRRAVVVGVTAAGHDLLGALATRRRGVADALTASLTPTELRTLRDLLARLDPSLRPRLRTPRVHAASPYGAGATCAVRPSRSWPSPASSSLCWRCAGALQRARRHPDYGIGGPRSAGHRRRVLRRVPRPGPHAPFADRGHACHLVLAGLLLDVVGLVVMAASTAFLPLLLGRFVMGIGVGTAVPAVRRIVIVAEPDRIGTTSDDSSPPTSAGSLPDRPWLRSS